MTFEKHFSVAEVAERLGFSVQWVRDQQRAGKFARCVEIAGEFRFPESALVEFLQARTVESKGKVKQAFATPGMFFSNRIPELKP